MIQQVMVTVGCVGMAVLGQIPLSTLLAQSSSIPITGNEDAFWKAANTLGAMAILGWYFFRTQTKTLPEKDAQLTAERAAFDAKVKATLDATALTVKATLDASALEMKSEREAHKAIVDRILAEHKEVANGTLSELREERNAHMEVIKQCGGKG